MRKKSNDREKELKRQKREKNRALKEADTLWHKAGLKVWGNICFFDKSSKKAEHHDKYTKVGHHIKPKGLYPNLRHEIDNFLPVCWACHFKLEQRDRSMIMDIREARGIDWYERLEEKARQKIKPSFKTTEYYKEQIIHLEDILK